MTTTGRRKGNREERIANMDRELLDVAGAAKVLGVSKTTVYRMAQAGKLPAARVGKEWRFTRRNLIEWVQNGGSNDNGNQLTALLKGANVRPVRNRN